MGRVKKYSRQFSNSKKRQHAYNKRVQADDCDMEPASSEQNLSVAKRKQIFKKKNRRDVKLRIKELRLKSLKLKKKDID